MAFFKLLQGKHWQGGKRYVAGEKGNDVVEMDFLPELFKDRFSQIESPYAKVKKDAVPGTDEKPARTRAAGEPFKAVHRGGGWYDVVNNMTGETITDKALKRVKADELIAELMETGVDNGKGPGDE